MVWFPIGKSVETTPAGATELMRQERNGQGHQKRRSAVLGLKAKPKHHGKDLDILLSMDNYENACERFLDLGFRVCTLKCSMMIARKIIKIIM